MPKLILIMGLPGTGKTYLAELIARRFKLLHMNSDGVRTSLSLRDHYKQNAKMNVYSALKDRVGKTLSQDMSVVVDATFYKANIRNDFVVIANLFYVRPCWIMTAAAEATIRQRLQRPRRDSQANYDVYLKIREEFAPMNLPHLVIETDQLSDEEMIREVASYCKLKLP